MLGTWANRLARHRHGFYDVRWMDGPQPVAESAVCDLGPGVLPLFFLSEYLFIYLLTHTHTHIVGVRVFYVGFC